jgi:Leucine-rich repeat (LRR) protein
MEHNDVLECILRAKASSSETLDLSNRGISEIPKEIGQVTRLKVLDLSYNQIKRLPSSIANLKKLEKLYLLRNQISELPTGIGNLSRLKVLDISYNDLTKIPSEIGFLHNLESFDASYCKLSKLPFELTELISLKKLNLDENPLTFPPQKVVSRGLYAIMHFLTLELRKSEASRSVIHVFNMPESLQTVFRQYNQLFAKMVSKTNQRELSVDMSFINPGFEKKVDLPIKPDEYILDLIRYLNQRVDSDLKNDENYLNEAFIETQFLDLKEQLYSFNLTLDEKIDSIIKLKNEMERFYLLLDKIKKE